MPSAKTGFKKAKIEYIRNNIPASCVFNKLVYMGNKRNDIPRKKRKPNP